MAYIVLGSQTSDQIATAVTSYTPATYPAGAQNNDIVFAFVVSGTNTAVLSCATSGWNIVGTRGASPTGAYGQFFYAVVSGGTYNVPTFASTASNRMSSIMFLVRDADTTTPIDVTLQTNYSSSYAPTTGGPTSTTNGALILHGWTSGVLSATIMPDMSKAQTLVCPSYGNTPSAAVTFAGQVSAGAIETYTAAINGSSSGTQWTVAVKNKTGGRLQPHVAYSMSVVSWYGNTAGGISPLTWYGAEETGNKFAGGIAGGTLGGITITTGAVTATNSGLTTTINTSAVDNRIEGAWHAVTLDCTNKVFSVEVSTSRVALLGSSSRIGTNGYLIGFSDGTNYEIFRVKNPARGWAATTDYRIFIACGKATPTYSSGTLNWAAITQVGYFLHHMQTAVDTYSMRCAFLLSDCYFTGGSASAPIVASDFAKIMLQPRLTGMTALQSTSQVLMKHSFSVADGGTRPTFYNSDAVAFAYPQNWSDISVANWQDEWNVPANSCTVSVRSGASDVVSYGASIVSADGLQSFDLTNASTSATHSFSGLSLINYAVTLKTGIAMSSVTFGGCSEIDAKGSGLTDCTIKNTVSTDAAIAFTEIGGSMTRCTIDVTGTSAAYHLELGTAVTSITLTDVTFTGTPTTDKVHVLRTSGTVTINLNGTTSLAAGDVTSAGATVVIASAPVYQSVTVSGFTAGSRIQIYDTTSSTELFNGTASSGDTVVSGSTATWTDPVAASASRAIRIRVAYVSGATAKEFIETSGLSCGTTSGSESVTYPVSSVDDATYNSNGIDGPAIYATSGITFTDAATDLVNCNIGGGSVTYPTIYACFVYWNFTATGIANDFTYISAPDTANYLLSGMKIRNTSATDLTVTGGYGRDATSGLSKDIIDTAGSTGNIFLAPDHVVAYQTTGTYAITGDISTVLTAVGNVPANVLVAAQATPIHSELKAINGVTVTGVGTSGDPWGPA